MLKRFNPQNELPVCQIKIRDLIVGSNHVSDNRDEESISLNNARGWYKNSLHKDVFQVVLRKGHMAMTLDEAEELIKGLQSMVNFLKS